ncbi:MAG: type II CAAX endopeptidase family protein [Nitrospira sp.]
MKTLDQAIALAGLFILSGLAVIPADWVPWIQVPLALSALGAAILSFKHGGGSGGEVSLVVAYLGLAMVAGLLWQAAMPLALLAYGFVAKQFLSLDIRSRWTVGKVPWWPTALCAAVAPIALVSWVLLMNPNIDDLIQPISRFSLPLLLAGSVVFVLLNAIGEELIWRGVFQMSLRTLFGSYAAIILQGLSFGVQHANGFPRGIVGVCLAFLWGLLQGWLRDRSGGLLAPMIAHIVADTSIVIIVLMLLIRS